MCMWLTFTNLFNLWDMIWDLIVSVPDHCLSFYFMNTQDVLTLQNIAMFIHLAFERRKDMYQT